MPTDSGGIIRVAHNRDNPYTMINRGFTEDLALSWEARGLLAYLLCKPDSWEVRVTDLQRKGNAGREMMRRMLGELERAGYLVRRRTHDAGGHWVWLSEVYEQPGLAPVTAQPSMVNPSPGEPPPGQPSIKEVRTGANSKLINSEGVAPEQETVSPDLAAQRARIQGGRPVDELEARYRDARRQG